MVHSSVVSILERGRGTRNLAHRVSEIVRNEPDLFPELMFGLWHVEGPIRCLAANAVEMVTREHPKMLQPFKTEILGLMTEARPAPVRCQLALLIPRMKLNKGETGARHGVAARVSGRPQRLGARPCQEESYSVEALIINVRCRRQPLR